PAVHRPFPVVLRSPPTLPRLLPRAPWPPLFPTRRSSDLVSPGAVRTFRGRATGIKRGRRTSRPCCTARDRAAAAHRGALLHSSRDRKSTRLNSSHVSISYAVFGWKQKLTSVWHHSRLGRL